MHYAIIKFYHHIPSHVPSVLTPPITSAPPSPSQWLTGTRRPDPAPRPVPVARGKTDCLLICFLIEFLPPFLRLVNPCTGLWADDWRVITGCWHVCFLWARRLVLLTAKAAFLLIYLSSPLCTSFSPPFSLLSSPSYLLALQLSLFFLLTRRTYLRKYHTPEGIRRVGVVWRRRTALYFLFRIKRKGTGPLFSIL